MDKSTLQKLKLVSGGSAFTRSLLSKPFRPLATKRLHVLTGSGVSEGIEKAYRLWVI